MIIATFDLISGWSFSGDAENDFGIRFTDGDAARIYPDGLAFGWTLLVDNKEVKSLSWPPSNIVIRELAPSRLFSYLLDAAPDDEVTLRVWATNAAVTDENETTFTIPRPAQPFPSWSWQDGEWVPPVPYPDTGSMFEWNEDSQQWELVP